MKIVLVICTLLLVYGVYEVVRVYSLMTKSRTLVADASAFTRDSGTRSMLVLGDSTAVGVGALSRDSVPGRLSSFLDASVENYAVSGARIRDLHAQIKNAKKERYDILLIQIGANDIMHGTKIPEVQSGLEQLFSEATTRSERVAVLTAGKVGDAPLIPWFVRSFLNARTARVRDVFIETAARHKVVYVDIYAHPLNFSDDVPRFYASDQFHLSGEGYGEWFTLVRDYVEKNWPELARQN